MPRKTGLRSPSVSLNPDHRFMVCTAWPLAPFQRLSSAEVITKFPVRGSSTADTSIRFVPTTCAVSGVSPLGRIWTNGDWP